MMQRDTNFKIGVGGSILEPDKSLIVMETRQTHLTIRFKMLGEKKSFRPSKGPNFDFLPKFRPYGLPKDFDLYYFYETSKLFVFSERLLSNQNFTFGIKKISSKLLFGMASPGFR